MLEPTINWEGLEQCFHNKNKISFKYLQYELGHHKNRHLQAWLEFSVFKTEQAKFHLKKDFFIKLDLASWHKASCKKVSVFLL